MALTREFHETSKALLAQAVEAYLRDDEPLGQTILRAMIHATIGFEQLAADLGKPGKSLRRMLDVGGNPHVADFFAMLRAVQKRRGVTLTVRAA